jgi:hypothetical protein
MPSDANPLHCLKGRSLVGEGALVTSAEDSNVDSAAVIDDLEDVAARRSLSSARH